ncbi:MAG: GIY-YIG nuclease family protein [Cyclobacteriaceae bacterium]
MHYVYLLRCSDGSIYTGCTNDIDDRLKRHQAGYIEYTSRRLPVELVFYAAIADQSKAYAFEKYLKSGSGTAFRNKHLI